MSDDDTNETLTERERELARRLVEQLEQFNLEASGTRDLREFLAVEMDDDDELAAGVYGWTWGGTCWIEAVWARLHETRGGPAGRRRAPLVEPPVAGRR